MSPGLPGFPVPLRRVVWAQAQHAAHERGGLVERVTRMELALSAWEVERLRLPGVPASQDGAKRSKLDTPRLTDHHGAVQPAFCGLRPTGSIDDFFPSHVCPAPTALYHR